MAFETPYEDLVLGTWSEKWKASQDATLPKHLISHLKPGPMIHCICGAGPFETMDEWSNHATKNE